MQSTKFKGPALSIPSISLEVSAGVEKASVKLGARAPGNPAVKPSSPAEESLSPIAEVASRTDSAYSTISPVLCEERDLTGKRFVPLAYWPSVVLPVRRKLLVASFIRLLAFKIGIGWGYGGTPFCIQRDRSISKSNALSLSTSRVYSPSPDKLFRHNTFSASSVFLKYNRRLQKEPALRPLSLVTGSPRRKASSDPSDRELDNEGFSPVSLNEDQAGGAYLSRRNTYAAPPSPNRAENPKSAPRGVTRRVLSRVKSKAGGSNGVFKSNMARYGTRVGEGHNNYALMYNMLTGIECRLTYRPLSRQDFKAANKLAFDITGNELTPSSKYDFKFKDYSPWVFRSLRELFGIDPAEYLLSLTLKYILSELSTPGKSGSFFYYSQDFRFIIKTVHHTEHKFFRKILPGYYEHVRANPDTLISRIYGLHRVKMQHTRKIHFVVMANVFPPTKDIHSQFDLKGSTLGRCLDEAAASEAKLPPVLKDLNWLHQGRSLELGPAKRQILFQQLRSDVDFLARHNIMDYSLLLGIHNLRRGNRDKLRQATLSLFDPTALEPKSSSRACTYSTVASDLRRQVAAADPVALGGDAPHRLPQEVGEERLQCIFYRDGGGFLATDEADEPAGELYCMGIIDIMTPYTMGKKVEHVVKSIGQDPNAISAVDPSTYAHRFLAFLTKSILHHEDLVPALADYGASHPSRFRPKLE
ncbi:Phosphatidylinositol-4-phosphate 5-kinase [Massospora cicadina]|nr:Phosphatidylinositol-4-phosphate 5-kinase [Massospora cicadina]